MRNCAPRVRQTGLIRGFAIQSGRGHHTGFLRKACARRSADTLLTPHPAEAARLLGESGATVQANRVQAARDLSRHFNAHVVLKGNGSIVAWDASRVDDLARTGAPAPALAGAGQITSSAGNAILLAGLPPVRTAADIAPPRSALTAVPQ